MKNGPKAAALLGAAALACAGAISSSLAAEAVPGWPDYLAMGAVGGPDGTPLTKTSRGGDDDFQGRPVDVVFKYAGSNGNGDPGIIDPPTNVTQMTVDLTTLSGINSHASRVAIVEYTAQMSGGFATDDFTNSPKPDQAHGGGTYLMGRHLISLSSDSIALNSEPVTYKGKDYFGTLILNPDLMGAIEQGNFIATVNKALPANAVDTAVDQVLCFQTKERKYHNTSNPNGLGSAPYLNHTFTGTPVSILEQMLKDGYPTWSINGSNDPYWNVATNNLIGGTGTKYSQIGVWFNQCVANPTYDTTKYQRPNFPAGYEGWVRANNWLIRTFSPVGHVSFGWQDNMWAVGTGYWVDADLTDAGIAKTYSTPLSDWLSKNAPSAIKLGGLGASYVPDYFVFDRYEADDSAAAGEAGLYSSRSWNNYVTAVGQVSAKFDKIPVMMWQIPGSHLPYVGEKKPELYNDTKGEYIFSTAPVYFFGESNLQASLGNLIAGPKSSTPDANTEVGNFPVSCGSTAYYCPPGSTYKQYLLYKKGDFQWGQDNGKLTMAANSHVFAILWGGGNTTSVIKNFSNPDDHGWLAGQIIDYYKKPTLIPSN
jgi:hypothetical protein